MSTRSPECCDHLACRSLLGTSLLKLHTTVNYRNFGERRLPIKRTIFFFAVLETGGPHGLGSKHVLYPTAVTSVHIDSVCASNSNLLMN